MLINSDSVYVVIALGCASIGAMFDLKSRKIPNFVTGPAFLFGILLHLALGGYRQMLFALSAGIVCGAAFLVFYMAGGMGAGDVKLIAAVACIAGMSRIVPLLVGTALAGGVLAVGLALLRGRLRDTLQNVGSLILHHGSEGLKPHPELNLTNPGTLRLPYALAIAAGSASTCLLALVQR